MTWQGVPWAIGAHPGGAPQIPAEAARAVAHTGKEGTSTPGDLAVVPTGTPSAAVVVRKGVALMLNRFPGGFGQSYVARNVSDDTVSITATAAGVTRTDLIAVVVEDPQYAGQPTPADAAQGPYVRTKVYTGVSANVKTLADVDPNQTGLALARVTLPPSTGTVQTSHITDLRDIPNPREKVVKKVLDVGDKGTYDIVNTSGYERFPQAASWTIRVPKWATVAQLELRVAGARVTNDGNDAGQWRGKARLKLGTLTSSEKILDPEIPSANKGSRVVYTLASEVAVPLASRGADLLLEAQALRESFGSGVELRESAGTTVIAEVRFIEQPNTDAPETFL